MPSISPEPEPDAQVKALWSTLPKEMQEVHALLMDWPWEVSRCRDELNTSKDYLGDYTFPLSTLKKGEEWVFSIEPLLRPESRRREKVEEVADKVDLARIKAGEGAVEFRDAHRVLETSLLAKKQARETRSGRSTPPNRTSSSSSSLKSMKQSKRPKNPTQPRASRPSKPFTPSSPSSLLTPIENAYRLTQHISVASYTFIRDAYLAGQTTPIGLTPLSTERKCRISVGKWLVKQGRIDPGLVELQGGKGMGAAVVGANEGRKKGMGKREFTEVEEVENLLGSPPSPPLTGHISITQDPAPSAAPNPPKQPRRSPSPASSLSSSPPPSTTITSSTSQTITTALIQILGNSPQTQLFLAALYTSLSTSNPNLFPPHSTQWKGIMRAVLSQGRWFQKTKEGLWKLKGMSMGLE